MQRIPEPELMNDADQAAAYAAADFDAPDRRFIEAFIELYGADFEGEIVDLGCGPGNITLRLAAALPAVRVVGVDGADAMLAHARARTTPDMAPRVRWLSAMLPTDALPRGRFQAVVSNSLLHHLHDPGVLWRAVAEAAASGAAVFIGDLRRPPTEEAALALVEQYVADEPPVLKADFLASLRAAFEVDEVRGQLEAAGLRGLRVEAIGDRHLRVSGRVSGRVARTDGGGAGV